MNEENLTHAIGELILEAAPERKSEIKDLWQKYSPQFERGFDKEGFAIEAGPWGLILFTPRTMGQVWLLGFAGWAALEAYCPYLLLCSEVSSSMISAVPDQAAADSALEEVLAKVGELGSIAAVDGFEWPSGIPEPSETLPTAVRERAIVDTIKIAAAYMFLHEVRHVTLAADSSKKPNWDSRAEELECDRFARDLLLTGVNEYCKNTGYKESAVLDKRLIGLALGGFLLLHITKKRGGSVSHPAETDRLQCLLANNEADANSYAWVYAACLLLSVLRREGKLSAPLAFAHPRDLFEKMLPLL
ncbi:phage exclusion protein Lit family protein [Oscillatoria amoena NRMC-F 0135]|nr:phage exclusion protein Lit family protein [Oscillatoria amoena NRMC-F 0135]